MRRKTTSRFMKKTISFLLAATMTIGNIGPHISSVYASSTEGVENFESYDANEGYEDYQAGEYIVPNESAEQEEAQPVQDTPVQNEATAPIQEATPETQAFPVLESGTFDLGKSSVYIYDDQNAQPFVEYGGVTYKNPGITSFVLTGSSDSNKAEIMSDREYSVMLKDLSLSCDTPLAFYGNGTTHVKVSGSVKLPSRGTSLFTYENLKIDFTFEDNASIQCGGNIGATGDGAQITVNNGHITGSEFFTGSPVIIKGGNIQAAVTNAADAAGTSLSPVHIENLTPSGTYSPVVSVNGEGYSYGQFLAGADGTAALYLPQGEISVVLGGVEYRGTNNADSPVLLPYDPQAETQPETQPETQAEVQTEEAQTEAVTNTETETPAASETEQAEAPETLSTEAVTENSEAIETEDQTEAAAPEETSETVSAENLTDDITGVEDTEAILTAPEETEAEAAAEEETEAETAAEEETEAETAAEEETEAETAAEEETEAETTAEEETEAETTAVEETEAETTAEEETEAETAAETETEAEETESETESSTFEYGDGDILVSTDLLTASANEESFIGDVSISLNAVKEGNVEASNSSTDITIDFPDGSVIPSLSIEDNKVVSKDGVTYFESDPAFNETVEFNGVNVENNTVNLSVSTAKNEETKEEETGESYDENAGESVSVASILMHADSVKVNVTDPEYKVEKEEIESYISKVNDKLQENPDLDDLSEKEIKDIYGISNYNVDEDGNYVFEKEEDFPKGTDYEKNVNVDMADDATINISASSRMMSDNSEEVVVNHLMARVPIGLLGTPSPGTNEYGVTSVGLDVGTISLDVNKRVLAYSGWTGPYWHDSSGISRPHLCNSSTAYATITFDDAAHYMGQAYDVVFGLAKFSDASPAVFTSKWANQMGVPEPPAGAAWGTSAIKMHPHGTMYYDAAQTNAAFTTKNAPGQALWYVQVLGAPATAQWHMYFADLDKDEVWGVSNVNNPIPFTTRTTITVGGMNINGTVYSTYAGTQDSSSTPSDPENNQVHVVASGPVVYGYYGTGMHDYGGAIISDMHTLYFNWTPNAAAIAATLGITMPAANTIGSAWPISTGGQFTIPGAVSTIPGLVTSGWYLNPEATVNAQSPYPPNALVASDYYMYADAQVAYGSVTPQKTVDMKGWNIAELPAANRTFGFTVSQTNEQTALQNATTNKTTSVTKTQEASQNAATVENVYVGTATVSETSYDSRIWALNTASKTVQITTGANATASFTNTYKTGNLTVTKTVTDPSGYNKHKAGFVFRLTGKSLGGSSVNVTATTNNNGVATFSNIPVGTAYTVKEELTNTQKQIFDDNTVQINNVTVAYNETRNVNYNNIYKTGNLTVTKLVTDPSGANTHKAGFVFRLTGKSLDGDNINVTATTNNNGVATFSNIPVGTAYTVREELTSSQEQIFENKTVVINNITIAYKETRNVNYTNIYKTGHIKVNKVVDMNGSMSTVNIEQISPDGFGTSLTGGTPLDSAITYKTLTGIIGQNTAYINNAKTPGTSGSTLYTDIPVTASGRILKETDTNLPGNHFLDAWTVEIGGVRKGDDGHGDTEGTALSVTYKNVAGYTPTEVTVKNILKVGTVTVQKLINDWTEVNYTDTRKQSYENNNEAQWLRSGRDLSGFKFVITGTPLADLSYNPSYTTGYRRYITGDQLTDANGVAVFRNVPYGTYTLTEVLTDEQKRIWHHKTKPITFTINDSHQDIVINGKDEDNDRDGVKDEVRNTLKVGNITMNKDIELAPDDKYNKAAEVTQDPHRNDTYKRYNDSKEGFVYHLYGYSDCGIYEDVYAVTNAAGTVRFDNILKATKTNPDGSANAQHCYTIIEATGQDVKDAADAGNYSAKKILRSWYVDQLDGQAQITSGKKPLQSVRQYVAPVAKTGITVTFDDAVADANAGAGQVTTQMEADYNKLLKWHGRFKKSDAESYAAAQHKASLAGAVYGLYDGDPDHGDTTKLIATFTTDENGYFDIPGPYVLGDNWYLRELPASDGGRASEGYLIDNTKYYIDCTIDDVGNNKNLGSPNSEENNLVHITNADTHGRNAGTRASDGMLIIKIDDGEPQTDTVYEPVKKNTIAIYKSTSLATDGEYGQSQIGTDPLMGAGFTVYEISAIEKKYGINLSNRDDAFIAQYIKDQASNTLTTGNYTKLINDGLMPATVYSEGALGAKEHYTEYYGAAPNVEVNEVLDKKYCPYDYNGAGEDAPLVKHYTYHDSDGNQIGSTFVADPSGTDETRYLAAEFFTNENGMAYSPMLPYGDYVLVETTVPYGKRAADPIVIHIRSDHNDGITEDDNDGEFLGLLDSLTDEDQASYVRIVKKDSNTNRQVLKEGAQFIIYDDEERFVSWLAEKTSPSGKEGFIAAYKADESHYANGKLLVVDPESGMGTLDHPYEYSEFASQNNEWKIQTPVMLPMGTYTLEELHAPEGYILRGNEGKYRKNTDDSTFWEAEAYNDAKWNTFSKEVTEEDQGTWDLDTSLWDTDSSGNPVTTKTFTVDSSNRHMDPALGEYYYQVEWKDDPAVGKLSIYAEGEVLKSAANTGTTVSERVGADFNGHPDAVNKIGRTMYDASTFKNKEFNWETRPLSGVSYTIYADSDIYSNDGSNTRLFAKDAVVARLTTDENGEAHTSSVRGADGRIYKGLPIGKYYIVQENVPSGIYVISDENARRQFEIEYEGETVPITFKDEAYKIPRKKIEIAIDKYDSVTGRHMDGAIFALVTKDDIKNVDGEIVANAGEVVALSETHDNGKATFDSENGSLPLSNYYVCEFSGPLGYATSVTKINLGDASMYEDSRTENYSFKNTGFDDDYKIVDSPVRVYIRLSDFYTDVELGQYKDGTLDGGEFIVYDPEGNEVTTVTTQANGENLLGDLTPGQSYYLEQVKAPTGYVNETLVDNNRALPYTEKYFDGVPYSVYKLSLTDMGANKVWFTVSDSQAEMQVVNVQNKPVIGTIRISKTGSIPDLDVEQGAGIGNDVADIMKERLPQFTTITNGADSRDISGIPVEFTSDILKGAEYAVYAMEDIVYPDGQTGVIFHENERLTVNGKDVFTTGSDGTVVVPGYARDEIYLGGGLLPGRYRVEETKAPEGYCLEVGTDKVEKIVTIGEATEYDADFDNDVQLMSMDLTKTAYADGEPFSSTKTNGETTTGVEGAVYALVALSNITNAKGKVLISPGVKVDEKTTDANGRITWRTDLPLGNYAAFETKAPAGYYLSSDVIYYNGEEYKSDYTTKTVHISKTARDDISIVKLLLMDYDTDYELAGAKFLVKDKNGNPVSCDLIVNGEKGSTTEGINTTLTGKAGHMIYGLTPGETYTFTEVQARYGYTTNIFTKDTAGNGQEFGETYEFTVPKDQPVSTIRLYNKRIIGRINLIKIGETLKDLTGGDFNYEDSYLEGVEFSLSALTDIYHPDGQSGKIYNAGEEIEVKATTRRGQLTFDNLYLGTYLVEEITFPEGYKINVSDDYVLTVGTFVLEDAGENQPVIEVTKPIENIRQRVKLNVEKKDAETGEYIGGGTYRLYAGADKVDATGSVVLREGEQVGEDLTLDETGKGTFELDLPLGVYYMEEAKAPSGYSLPTQERIYLNATAAEDGRDVVELTATFENHLIRVAFDVLDFNDESKRLTGTKIMISGGDLEEPITTTIEEAGTNPVFTGFNPGVTYTITVLEPVDGYTDRAFRKDRGIFTTPYAEDPDGYSDGNRRYTPVTTADVFANSENTASFYVENVGGVQVATIFNKKQTRTVINVLDHKTKINLESTIVTIYDTENGKYVGADGSLHDDRQFITIDDMDLGSRVIYDLVPGTKYILTEEKPREGYKWENIVEPSYESEIVRDGGYPSGSKKIPAQDTPSKKEYAINQSTFTTEEYDGIQVVTIFNAPVMTDITVTKKGGVPVIEYDENDPKRVKGITWSEPVGLDGAQYTLTAKEDIVYPDGRGEVIFSAGEEIAKLKTKDSTENGKVIHGTDRAEGLYLGKYVLRETKAPKGYSIDYSNGALSTIKELNLLEDFYEERLYSQEKYNEDLHIGRAGDLSATYTNERKGLDIGKEPDIPITNDGGDPKKAIAARAGIRKIGVDNSGEEVPVDGAIFQLSAAERIFNANGDVVFEKGDIIDTKETVDGTARFTDQLPVGHYLVKEIDAPEGYYSSGAVIDINTADEGYDEDSEVQMIRFDGEIRNPLTEVHVHLKDDLTKKDLAGATFKVVYGDGEKEGQIAKNPDGSDMTFTTVEGRDTYVLKGLDPEQKYVLIETAPRNNYTNILRDENGDPLDPDSIEYDENGYVTDGSNEYEFTISDIAVSESLDDVPEAVEIFLYNRFITGDFIVNKNGEILKYSDINIDDPEFNFTDEELAGAEFTIKASEFIYHPDGWTQKDGGCKQSYDDRQEHLFAPDETVLMNVRIVNNHDGSYGIAAVQKTADNGIAQFIDLYPGAYYIIESNTPEGYSTLWADTDGDTEGDNETNANRYNFRIAKIDEKHQKVSAVKDYTNLRQKVRITVTKHDAEDYDKTIAGATYVLKADGDIRTDAGRLILRDGSVIERATTGEDGVAAFTKDLPLRNYVIYEEEAPKGYVLNSTQPIYVNAQYNNNGDEVIIFNENFENEQTKTLINVLDADTNVELDDVVLTLMDEDGNLIKVNPDGSVTGADSEGDAKITTKHNENVLIRGLEPGKTYTVVETKPRHGYSDNIYSGTDYENDHGRKYVSTYQEAGVYVGQDEAEHRPAYDLKTDKTGRNRITFTVKNEGGVQVVSILNKPVLVRFNVHKRGPVASTIEPHASLESITWSDGDLSGAKYILRTKERIPHPDGYSEDIYAAGAVVAGEDILTTDETGCACLEDLLYLGKYEIEETKAPEGYVRIPTETKHEIDLDAEFTSLDAGFGDYVFDVENMYYNERQIVDTGNFDGFHPDPEIPGNGDPDGEYEGKAGIYKVGIGNTKEAGKVYVAGAEYKMYADGDIIGANNKILIHDGKLVGEATTDENGRAVFDTHLLPIGRYVIKETKAPAGYHSTGKEVIFEADKYKTDDSVQIVRLHDEFENNITRTVIYLKDDLTHVELAGADLTIRNADGSIAKDINGNDLVFENIEDSHGKGIVVYGLETGKDYYIEETKPRDGYTYIIRDENGTVLDPDDIVYGEDGSAVSGGNKYPFQIADNPSENPADTVINLYNAFVTANLYISKTGEVLVRYSEDDKFDFEDSFLEGVEFTLTAAEDIYHPDGKTGPDGEQAESADGSIQPLFKKGDDIVLMNVRGSYSIKLPDGSRTSDPTPAVTVTDANGIATFLGLYLGSYTIKETKVPEGYVDEHIEKTATATRENFAKQVVECVEGLVGYDNLRQKVNITVTKLDAESKEPVGGAVFRLKNVDPIKNELGDVIVEAGQEISVSEPTDDESGKTKFDIDLPLGMYYIEEAKAPYGYVSAPEGTKIFVDARYQGEGRKELNFDVQFENEITKTLIEILDREPSDGEYASLDDTQIILKDGDNKIPAEKVDGKYIAKGLQPGTTYTIIETAPQYGYIANPIQKTYLTTDGRQKDARGYESVYGREGYDGINATDIPADAFNENTMTFTTRDIGGYQVITVFNRRVEASLNVEKKGEVPVTTREHEKLTALTYTVTGLPNAEYTLVADETILHPDKSGRVIFEKGENVVETLTGKKTLVTDNEGKAQISGLYLGKYTLTEVKAPFGYSKFSEDVTRTKYDETVQTYIRTIDFTAKYDESYFAEDASYDTDIKITEEYVNDRVIVDIGSDEDPDPENPEGDPNAHLYKKTGVYKIGDDNGERKGVQGATFELYAASNIKDALGNVVLYKDEFIESVVTDEDGRAAFKKYDLPVGDYYVIEKTPPKGYFSSSKRVDFKVVEFLTDRADDERDHIQIVRLNDEIVNPITTTIVYLRDVVTDYELEGARFQVLEADGVSKAVDETGNPIEWRSIDTGGEGHVIKGLDPDKDYIIEEILPREGYTYILRDEDGKKIHNVREDGEDVVNRYRFRINDVETKPDLSNAPEPTVINLYNQYVTANVILSKDGEVLTGHDNMTVSDLIKSLFDYTAIDMPAVEFTIYALEDVIHPDGHTGLITRGGESVKIKADKDGIYIAQKNVLELSADGVFGEKAVSLTEADGAARWNDLFLGHYLIRETSTPEGYATNFKDIEFTAAYDSSEPGLQHVDELFEGEDGYHNIRQKVKITVTKRDSDDHEKTVAGAKFGLYATEDIRNARGVRIIVVPKGGSVLLEEAVTDEDGVAVFETDLPLGHYVIREIDAPYGYILSQEEIQVDASYQDDETHALETQTGHDYDFYNEQTKTIINVLDIDTLVELDDVHLTLTDEDGNVVEGYEDITTVHEGNILIRGLEPGKKYIVEETVPRYGYSNETFIGIHTDNDYESEYAKKGYERDDVTIAKATDLKLRREGRSKIAFTTTTDSGLQVVSIFNERVKANIEITKEGPVPTATLEKRKVSRNGLEKTIENKVTGINYDTIKGLPGAQYDIIAAEDIYHPDGWTGPNGLRESESASQEPLYKEGDVIAHVTTDASGKASFGAIYKGAADTAQEQLYIGNYTVKETKAPRGYVRIRSTDYTDQPADIDDQYRSEFEAVTDGVYTNSTYDLEEYENPRQLVDLGQDYDEIEPEENEGGDPLYKNYLLAGIHKIGVDGKDKSGVANAKFSLYAEEDIKDVTGKLVIPKDTRIETSWSSDDGRAVFTDFELPVGKYYVVEDDAPKGYYSASSTAHFDTSQYEDNDEVQVIRLNETIENPVVTVKVFLKDTVTKVELPDALLRIEDEDGKFVTSFVTKDTEGEGYIIKGQMAPGKTYTITEVYPKDNNYTYIIRDENGKVINPDEVNKYTFKIDDIDPENPVMPEEVVINLYNEFVTGYVQIRKNGEVLKDYDPDSDKQFTYEGQTLKGITFVLVAAEDIYHPDGVTGPNGTKDTTLDGRQIPLFEEGEVVLMNVTKTPELAMSETNNKGIATFEGLYPGKYEFREMDVAQGYTKPNDKAKDRTFTIVPIDFKTQIVQAREGLIEYTNKRQHVNILITKLDKDTEEPLSGAQFTLYAAADVYNSSDILILEKGEAIETATTGQDGTATFEANLPASSYTLKETKAPDGYVLDRSEIAVNASWSSDGRDTVNVKKTVYNEKAKADIVKVSSDKGENLAGAQLAVIDKTDKVVETWTTGKSAKRIEGLKTGDTYTLTETKPAPGYATAKDVTFTVNGPSPGGSYEAQKVEMTDDPITIQIRINEILEDGSKQRLGTVPYHVEDEFGNIVNVDDRPLSFVSTDSDDERIVHIPIGQYRIVIDSVPTGYIMPKPTPITVRDTSETQYFHVDIPSTRIEIVAVDKYTRAVLTKVKIDLMAEDGNEYQTNLPLTLRKDKVQPGSYVIHVTQGPSGYVAPDDETIAVLPVSELQKFVIELDHTTIDVYAVDKETGQMVSGVTVDIVNKNDVPIAHDVPLEYIQEYVPSGKYTIIPTNVPSGYNWPENQNIHVRQISDIQRFKIELGIVKASFRPVDAQTNKVVKGVKMVLRGPNGDEYTKWTSKEGWMTFKPINPGEYLLEATKVPGGYNMPEAEKIKIENISDMQYFELKLTKGTKTPSSGGTGAAAAAAAAVITSDGSRTSRGGGKPATSPKTGDPFSYAWIYLALASGFLTLMLALILRRRRRRNNF